MDAISRSSFPAHNHNHAEVAEPCFICRDDFYGREVTPVMVEPRQCQHRYDLDCITDWFQRLPLDKRVCCICQKPALPLRVVSGSPDKTTPFIRHEALEAVDQGDTERLAALLACEPELALRSFRDPEFDNQKTLLHAAAKNGHVQIVELLLERGVDVGAKTAKGEVAVFLAANLKHWAVVRLLI